MACVELPAFPLQLLLKQYPDWVDQPVAVVDRDKPHGVILWTNKHAHAFRIRTGMRYSAGLSLARTLYAGEVTPAAIEEGLTALVDQLRQFSPDVEPCYDEPGVVWLNASGLKHLYESPRHWANEIKTALQADGFRASVVVGFTRFGTYSISKTVSVGKEVVVVRDETCERVLAEQVPLERLGLKPALSDSLQKLGVRTVQAFLQLPAGGIYRRFGKEAQRLHRLASGDVTVPLQPLLSKDQFVQCLNLDDPEVDISRLLFSIERLLSRLLETITTCHKALAALTLQLWFDLAGQQIDQICPAAPTIDIVQLMDLVRLRLESLALESGVTKICITALAFRTKNLQQGLFVERPRRDLATANRALARIRGEFGDAVVAQARLTDAHLPEAQFSWEPAAPLTHPEPSYVSSRSMVRRIHAHSIQLSPRLRCEPDSWLTHGSIASRIRELTGPYLVSGGWWRSIVHREYYFAHMHGGDVLWIYYDRPRQRWFCQGQVE